VPTFAEFGIGLTVTSEPYRKSERKFSSTFNFGDHLAIGWAFGARREHELVLRVEHFSNGNIKLPNPGENFREVRYVHWF
jgi:lipid A 3-O-deacylase